jgi:catechol 2,3-dioxygenase-like lactoylglutathione lyase family enzyme
MKLRYIILYVSEPRATVDFYTRAFGVEPGFVHPSGDYAEMVTGETKLAFSAISLMQSLGKTVAEAPVERPSFEIAFEVVDVAAAVARAVEAGAALVSAPAKMDWGQTIAYVRAPEGTLVEICTPVG